MLSDDLQAKLDAHLLRALLRAWNGFNQEFFTGKLRAPQLVYSDAEGRLGAWHADTRTISLQRAFVRSAPWLATLEVLKHEMAHQYVHEALSVRGETAHGPAFQEVCGRLGIDARASGAPEAQPSEDEERLARRIRKLLALAESPNAQEAESAMNMARKLLLQHNLEVTPAGYGFRQLGAPLARLPLSARLLANLLGSHFFVDVIWVPALDPETGAEGKVLEVLGSPGNLDMAVYVHGFVQETAWRLWKAHRLRARVHGERERERFTAGVIRGFTEKLAEGQRQSAEEGLVWLGDPGVQRYLKQRHPHVRTVSYRGAAPSESYEHGRAAGREIVLHKPIQQGPSGEVRRIGRSS
jgi:hypothetical protein